MLGSDTIKKISKGENMSLITYYRDTIDWLIDKGFERGLPTSSFHIRTWIDQRDQLEDLMSDMQDLNESLPYCEGTL